LKPEQDMMDSCVDLLATPTIGRLESCVVLKELPVGDEAIPELKENPAGPLDPAVPGCCPPEADDDPAGMDVPVAD
jgi:hypothetical protein